MTNSTEDLGSTTSGVLTALLQALDPEALTRTTVEPVQRAAATYPMPETEIIEGDEFLATAGCFLQHFYWRGRSMPVQLSELEARARALSLLEERYDGGLGEGYAGALLDGTRPEGAGIGSVLWQLAGIVAQEELRHRVTAVLTEKVPADDWWAQRQLVGQILARLRPSLPPHLAERPVDSLVSVWRDLILLVLEIEGFLGSGAMKLKRS